MLSHSGAEKKKLGWQSLTVIAVVTLALLWIAWRIVIETAAQNLALVAPHQAVRLVPDQAAALDQLAQQQLIDPKGDLDAAKAWAEQSLRANPLDDRALVLLGFIADRQGDRKTADSIAQLAGERSWRNPVTQLWLFEREVRRAEFAAALTHADALLRANLQYRDVLFPSLAAFTREDRSRAALAALLAGEPPWRSWFLQQLSAKLVNQAWLNELYATLLKSKAPPTNEELVPYLRRLVQNGDFVQAHDIWRERLPPARRADNERPYNADFAQAVDGSPFDWDLSTWSGADVQVVKAQGDKRGVLHLQFSGARISPLRVGQLMLLPPGHYRLNGMVKTDSLHTDRGLWWLISCAGKQRHELAHTDLVSGSVPWTEFAVDFDVPATGCVAQNLLLQLPARIPSESRIEGEVWYQGLRITSLAQGAATTPRE